MRKVFFAVAFLLFFSGCLSPDTQKNKSDETVKERPENVKETRHQLFMDSLKFLLNNAVLIMDSLHSVKKGLPNRNSELDKKIHEQEEEYRRLLAEIEMNIIVN